MRCFIGIDLGSTTTKAVVIDENQNIIGRGITNSRSNYDTAAAIAKSASRSQECSVGSSEMRRMPNTTTISGVRMTITSTASMTKAAARCQNPA